MIIDTLHKFSTKSLSFHFCSTLSEFGGRGWGGGGGGFGNDEIYDCYTWIEVKFTVFWKKGCFSNKSHLRQPNELI